jgi:NADH-quinone oxidoreductase subunit L
MLLGTLAIAGIFPFSGFFSKDEILFRTFEHNKAVWVLAVAAAFMTAFYMFRLMAMTFLGGYRGPAWEAAHGGGHGHAAHDAHGKHDAPGDDAGHDAGHGHGAWHGPHESPSPMTLPLQVLAVGACVAGFVGIPAALGGGNAIEHFLEPSFTAEQAGRPGAEAPGTHTGTVIGAAAPGTHTGTVIGAAAPGTQGEAVGGAGRPGAEAPGTHTGIANEAEAPGAHTGTVAGGHTEEAHISVAAERGLMAFSVFLGLLGIFVAYRFYVRKPEISEMLARRFAGPHRVLSNKYYVDELYGATFVRGTLLSGAGLWSVDRNVVDGAVNGSGWLTIFTSWVSGLIDKYIVDGLVNLVGWSFEKSSFVFRRAQTGLIQNYALLMLFGVFAFVTYLLLR